MLLGLWLTELRVAFDLDGIEESGGYGNGFFLCDFRFLSIFSFYFFFWFFRCPFFPW